MRAVFISFCSSRLFFYLFQVFPVASKTRADRAVARFLCIHVLSVFQQARGLFLFLLTDGRLCPHLCAGDCEVGCAAGALLSFQRWASKKQGGSTSNGRDSNPKYLGLKVGGGQARTLMVSFSAAC